MKRIVLGVVGLAAVAAIVVGLWSAWSAEAQTVRWVNDADGQPVGVDECDTAPYNSIAGALAAAGDDDIIRLCEGTYAGNVTVDRKVTIEGREGASIADVVIEELPADPHDGLIIVQDDVTVQHLKLDGPSGSDRGIWVKPDADHVTIDDVEATDWHDGVRIEDNDGAVVQGSDINNNDDDGIHATGSTDTVITANTVSGNHDFGVLLVDQDQTVVQGNIISSNGYSQIALYGAMHVRILGNTIDVGSDGIEIDELPAEAFVQIGGSPENANTFTGTPGGGEYYVIQSCAAENTVDATYNWWGTTNPAAIRALIYNDEEEKECADPAIGAVVFHPWATGPAPTPTPSPTATPTPTATATATATPTATPTPSAGTRDFSLEAGWNNFVWTGADGTAAGDVLSCIADDLTIAYMWGGATTGYLRYVPGRADITNLETVDKYDALLVLVTADTQCTGMPVEP